MSDLLTRAEYQAIADNINFPQGAFIDGRAQPGKGSVLPSTNPATGECLVNVHTCNAADVDHAVSKAREAFEHGSWSRKHPAERKDILIRLCKLIHRNRLELAVMECLDSGKPIKDCEEIDIP